MTRTDINALKDKVDIEQVLLACGARIQTHSWGENRPVWCPFCTDIGSRNPAGSVNIVKQLYYCWNCGAKGDVISLAKLYLQTDDFREAVRWLEKEFA